MLAKNQSDVIFTRKGLGRNVLGSICQWLDWLDDAEIRNIWPEATTIWHRATRFTEITKTPAIPSSGIRRVRSFPTNLQGMEHLILKEWRINGKLHRGGDQPAAIYANGYRAWFQNNNLHRTNDLPAIALDCRYQEWYQYGKRHRNNDKHNVLVAGVKYWYVDDKLHSTDDKPAIIYPDGTLKWYKDGAIHRENDLPAIIYNDGRKIWYQHNAYHRVKGPAYIEPDGYYEWYKNGMRHRDDDLPATGGANKGDRYYRNDKEYFPFGGQVEESDDFDYSDEEDQ